MYQRKSADASSSGCALGPLAGLFGLVSSIGGYFLGQRLMGDPVAGVIGALFAIPLVTYAARESALCWLLAGVGLLVGFGGEVIASSYGPLPAGEVGLSFANPYVGSAGAGLTLGALGGYIIGCVWPQLEIRGWRLINSMFRADLFSDNEK